jgi:5-methylcytosine-specific restriction enzyme subunit McrC
VTTAESKLDYVRLQEQAGQEVLLSTEDAALLRELKFDVNAIYKKVERKEPEGAGLNSYFVNPKQYVGHFLLPSGTRVVVEPKIDAANVFRMLAYVYAREKQEVFLEAEVSYRPDQFLFEPLVELFNALVANRVRRGLFQDYVTYEENLSVFRGRLIAARHLQQNLARPDRIFCRFSPSTHDVEDNQIVKWTLWFLLRAFPWSSLTVQRLRANLHQFEAVSLKQPDRLSLRHRHYHRLNEDYRFLHDLCRLFLDRGSISETGGRVRFRGFLLDMNDLFEDFITTAFQVVGRASPLLVVSQATAYLSLYPLRIRPDITIRKGSATASVVDAKYKRSPQMYENHDFYQMLAYATALNCKQTFLIFPSAEYEKDGPVEIVNSPVTIEVRRVNISDKNCVQNAERVAQNVLSALRYT